MSDAEVLGGNAQAQRLLDESAVQAIIAILPGFSRDLDRGDSTSVQVLVDGTNSNTALDACGTAGSRQTSTKARTSNSFIGIHRRTK